MKKPRITLAMKLAYIIGKGNLRMVPKDEWGTSPEDPSKYKVLYEWRSYKTGTEDIECIQQFNIEGPKGINNFIQIVYLSIID